MKQSIFRRTRQIIAGALLIMGSSVSPALTATVYSYTGNPFVFLTNSVPNPPGAYDSTMSVNGSFTLENPLPSNLPFQNIFADVLDFSFFDGRNSLTIANTGIVNNFSIETNASGAISTWSINLQTSSTSSLLLGQQAFRIFSGSGSDIGNIFQCVLRESNATFCQGLAEDRGQVNSNPGTWAAATVGPSAVPLPAALPLYATGIGVLGLLGWQRKRRMARAAA